MAELAIIFDTATGQLTAKQVGGAQLADLAVVSGKLANSAVISGAIASGQIGTPHIAAGAVVSALVGANALATPHIANQGILSASFGAGVLATPHLLNQGILSASIGANVIANPHIANQGLLSSAFGAGVLATPHLQNQGILSASFGANVIGAAHLANQAVLSAGIGSGQIGSDHVTSGARFQAINANRLGINTGTPGSGYRVDVALPAGEGVRIFGADVPVLVLKGTTSGDRRAAIRWDDNADDPLWSILPESLGGGLNVQEHVAGNPTRVTFASGGAFGIGTQTPSAQLDVTSSIAVGGRVDNVDVSAHTHTGGAGDAGLVLSAGVGSGQIGRSHLGPAALEMSIPLFVGGPVEYSPITSAWTGIEGGYGKHLSPSLGSGSPFLMLSGVVEGRLRVSLPYPSVPGSAVAVIAFGPSVSELGLFTSARHAFAEPSTIAESPWGPVSSLTGLNYIFIHRFLSGAVNISWIELQLRKY